MAAGEITPDEAVSVARFLEGRMRVLKAWQLEQKLTRWDNPLPIPGDDRPSPIPYPPPKEGWPDVLERVRLWGAPWPPPAAPSSRPIEIPSPPAVPSSSPPGERIEVRGSRRAPVPPGKDAQAEALPLPNLSPRGEEKRPLVHMHSACNSRLPTPHLMRHVLLGTTAYRSLAAG